MSPVKSKSVDEINRLLDTTYQCIRTLRLLGRPVEHWDDWFVQLVVINLDASNREDWEKSLEGSKVFPTDDTLSTFLENRIKSLDIAYSSDAFVKGNESTGRSLHIAGRILISALFQLIWLLDLAQRRPLVTGLALRFAMEATSSVTALIFYVRGLMKGGIQLPK